MRLLKSVDSRLLAVLACFLWSTAFLGVKVGLDSMPPLLFAGLRFLGAGLAVGVVYSHKDTFRQIRTHWRLVLLTGFLQTFMLYSLFFYSLTFMHASTGAIVNGLGPLIVAVSAHFFIRGSRLSRSQFFCLLLGVLGVILVALAGNTGADSGGGAEWGGILLMVAALTVSAAASIVVARSPDGMDPFILNAGQLVSGSLMLLLAALLRGDRPYNGLPEFKFWIAFFWLILVTGGGFSIWYYLLKVRKEALAEIAVWKFLIPLGGAVFSWLFLQDDNAGVMSFSGMILTALSIFLFYQFPAGGNAVLLQKEGED